MQRKLPKELEEWVYYDETKFKYILKENAPEDIKKKFEEHEQEDLERYEIK